MSFDPEKHDWEDKAPQSPPPTRYSTSYRSFEADTWVKLGAVWGGKTIVAVMFAASFMVINPIGINTFIGDFLPVPDAIGDISMCALINFGLGVLAVMLPTILWGKALEPEFQRAPLAYFQHQPVRIGIGALLILAYGMMVALEVMALLRRIAESRPSGPFATLTDQPEILPMAVASAALILGSCLLGLSSAVLSKSIHDRYAVRIRN